MLRLLDLDFYAEHFDGLLLLIFVGGVALLVGSAFVGTGADIIVGDSRYYFEYARSIVAIGHLPATHIKYPCGVALIGSTAYLPAALIAKLAVRAGLLGNSERIASGWAMPLQVAYCLPLLILSFIAFRANVATFVRLGYSSRLVKPMVLFWIVATNVGFYTLKEPAMSESSTYATLSLFYWGLVRWFYLTPEERTRGIPVSATVKHALALGVFLGLASTVRQQNILHAVALPLLLLSQRRPFGETIRLTTAAAVSSALLFVLPWAAWYAADGRLSLFSYGDEHFNFLSPHPLDALFHPGYHGLFVWHPAFAVAAVGLVAFLRRHRELRLAWIAPIAIQFYLIAAWYWLSFGASVGHRGFFTMLPLLLAGWIAAGDALVERGRSRTIVVGAFALTAANAVVTVMLLTGRLNPVGLPPR